ncbi:malto-oligosyltrehalose synthase [Stenotrophomonas bentonitica]|uniref:malto-oligosyltrehalose synthase n=1 Tax=Stenotrophomonas bentonitica TaxID=1450134 RepID=UPI003A779BFE
MVPFRATARLQLHAGFDFDAARAQVDYYASLGISHLYLSPIASAVPGSTHGYDVIDPTTVNPELGGVAGLQRLSDAVRARGMGLILDIVPNHMAAHPLNPYWADVLAHGKASAHAGWFDIAWRAPGRDGKLWLPVLDRPLSSAIAEGMLTVQRAADGSAGVAHHGTVYPLAPSTWAAGGSELTAPALAGVLAAQPYRLAWWRSGDDRINYRRFFTIASLVALQMHRCDVFETVHALPLRLVAEGRVDGLRVDHVDGLRDPAGYLHRLRAALDAAGARRGLSPGALGLWVEKILAPDEALRADWPCDGTTGYDFMDQVGALLHSGAGGNPLTRHWQQVTGDLRSFREVELEARRDVLEQGLRAEFDAFVARLVRLSRLTGGIAADFGRPLLARAALSLLSHFPVYRSYLTHAAPGAEDRRLWQQAIEAAIAGSAPDQVAAIEQIAAWVLAPPSQEDDPVLHRRCLALRQRAQLLSAPLNAKAVEDSSFYRHAPLLSRNEVGSHPTVLSVSAPRFHGFMRARHDQHPRSLLATATHDHKRGEDARMRLAVVSAWPEWWLRQVRRFERLAAPLGAGALHAADREMLWQTLVSVWRAEGGSGADLAARVVQWQAKALREGGQRSSWDHPDEAYESCAAAVVEALIDSDAGQPFRAAVQDVVARIAPAGARFSLSQTALRLSVPGVPDLYQGTEGWDLSLVDPDNRRPVDYALRGHWRRDARAWPVLLQGWRDGVAKARLVQTLLQARSSAPELFALGGYVPLPTTLPERVLAFAREHGAQRLIVVAAIATTVRPAQEVTAALPARFWGTGRVTIPQGRYRNLLTGTSVEITDPDISLRALSDGSPVTLLINE